MSYTINPNTHEVTLSYTESIDINTFRGDPITITSGQTSRQRAPVAKVKLTGGTVAETKSSLSTVVFKVLPGDISTTCVDTTPGTADTSMIMFRDPTMVTGMCGTRWAIVDIKSDGAFKAQTMGVDTTKHTVSDLALDMDILTLTITFSETVKISTFAKTARNIASTASGGAAIAMTAGTTSVKDDPAVTLPLNAAKIKKASTFMTTCAITSIFLNGTLTTPLGPTLRQLACHI